MSDCVRVIGCTGDEVTWRRSKPKRGVVDEEANYQIADARLRMGQSLEVGILVDGRLLADEDAEIQRHGGKGL